MYGVGECNSLISNNIHLLWKPFDDLITWVAFVKPIYLSFDGIFGFLCYKYIDINFQFNLSFNKSFWPCIADNTQVAVIFFQVTKPYINYIVKLMANINKMSTL